MTLTIGGVPVDTLANEDLAELESGPEDDGAMEAETTHDLQFTKKSRHEIFKEIISKTRQHRLQHEKEREEQRSLRNELDEDFGEFSRFLKVHPTGVHKTKEAEMDRYNYNTLARTVGLERTVVASDRLRTAEELEEKEQERVEILELARQDLMEGSDTDSADEEVNDDIDAATDDESEESDDPADNPDLNTDGEMEPAHPEDPPQDESENSGSEAACEDPTPHPSPCDADVGSPLSLTLLDVPDSATKGRQLVYLYLQCMRHNIASTERVEEALFLLLPRWHDVVGSEVFHLLCLAAKDIGSLDAKIDMTDGFWVPTKDFAPLWPLHDDDLVALCRLCLLIFPKGSASHNAACSLLEYAVADLSGMRQMASTASLPPPLDAAHIPVAERLMFTLYEYCAQGPLYCPGLPVLLCAAIQTSPSARYVDLLLSFLELFWGSSEPPRTFTPSKATVNVKQFLVDRTLERQAIFESLGGLLTELCACTASACLEPIRAWLKVEGANPVSFLSLHQKAPAGVKLLQPSFLMVTSKHAAWAAKGTLRTSKDNMTKTVTRERRAASRQLRKDRAFLSEVKALDRASHDRKQAENHKHFARYMHEDQEFVAQSKTESGGVIKQYHKAGKKKDRRAGNS
ncbi:MAG: hypothetical protein KVP17_004741 [Porospora cf. gigantea B]|nr:MAG: hypothetical protein KVP17_004741 [Porospora cf. gigantea B]